MQVWDLSTRLYHWAQAVLFVLLVISGNEGEDVHVDLGIALAILVLWRIMWGVWGSETNRFTQFVRSPLYSLKYLMGKVGSGVGHNPAGGWMVVVMLITLLGQCVSGFALAGFLDNLPYAEVWFTDEVFDALEDFHVFASDFLPVLVVIHVLAILVYKLRKKPLLKAMLTGQQNEIDGAATEPFFVPQWRSLLTLAIAAGGVFAILLIYPRILLPLGSYSGLPCSLAFLMVPSISISNSVPSTASSVGT